MTKWEKEVLQSLLSSEADAIKELEAQYKRALKDIGEKVKGFQADIDLLDAALNQEGLDENTKALLKSQKQSKIYQKQYQQALQGQVSGILDKMQADNYSTIESYLKTSYEDSYIGTMYDLAQQGVPVITPINQASAVQAILTDSKVSGTLYSALGVDVGKLKKSITQEISRGIASGLLYSDISRNISNVSGAPLSRAKTITRTEGHRIQNTASRNAALEAKAHGADLVKLWDATLDGKTRPSHRMVDGEIKELNEKFSNGLDRPGDPDGSAAEVINCRCQEFHKPRWDAEGAFLKRDNFTGEVLTFNSPKDYAEFKERYWSKENLDYMQKTAELETKYGTKKYDKLIDKMSDREYEQFKKLEDASPMWKTSAAKKTSTSKKAVEKSKNSGIIDTDKDVLTHRKIGNDNREIINQATYHRLTNPVIKKGGTILTATDENGWQHYLDNRGATAVSIGDTIIFRPDATTTEVLEEVYHFNQNRLGLNILYSSKQRMIMNEIDAQEYLISVADKYKIPQTEREETQKLLESYKKQMEELKKAGEWDD